MSFEPQKFFIGVVDFFSILMPGALLSYLGKDWIAAQLGVPNGFAIEGSEAVIVFLFSSYLLGHFAFLFGSILDDLIYDPLRALTDWGQIKRLANGKSLSSLQYRRLAASHWLFHSNTDAAVIHVQRIKARALQSLGASDDSIAKDPINVFQWAKARLQKDLPEGLVAVQRFEADSKFFRSFVVVLGVLVLFYVFRREWFAGAVCFMGMMPALWRYIDQRFKATQQAYWFAITLAAEKDGLGNRIARPDGLTHAGAVVYRLKENSPEFLLVAASDDRSKRVLPKGHIEAGEGPRITVAREVKEETGHWACVEDWLNDLRIGEDTDAPMVRWFLMHSLEEGKQRWREDRQHEWLPLIEATNRATYPETKALLAIANRAIEDKRRGSIHAGAVVR